MKSAKRRRTLKAMVHGHAGYFMHHKSQSINYDDILTYQFIQSHVDIMAAPLVAFWRRDASPSWPLVAGLPHARSSSIYGAMGR